MIARARELEAKGLLFGLPLDGEGLENLGAEIGTDFGDDFAADFDLGDGGGAQPAAKDGEES